MDNNAIEKMIGLFKERGIDVNQIYLWFKKLLFSKCVSLIKSKTDHASDEDCEKIFFESYLVFFKEVLDGKFVYQSYGSFLSHFKTICVNKSYEYIREFKMRDGTVYMHEHDNVGDNESDINLTVREEFLEDKKGRYGIVLDFDEEEPDPVEKVIEIVKTMSEICRFLIILKFFAKLSHREIADALHLFFNIRSEDVSKTTLNRCIKSIRARL